MKTMFLGTPPKRTPPEHYTIFDDEGKPTGCFRANNARVVTGVWNIVVEIGGQIMLSEKASCPFCTDTEVR